MSIQGFIKVGCRTKDLIKNLKKWDIPIICHDDIDELAAQSIISTGITTLINTGKSMTGKYHSKGTEMLLKNGIKLFDVNISMDHFKTNDFILINGRDITINKKNLYFHSCVPITLKYIESRRRQAAVNSSQLKYHFVKNTLAHANDELESILYFNEYPLIKTNIRGRTVLIVVRAMESAYDLKMLKGYISYYNPVLIGVDGGADILIQNNYTPDILIGDMDSVSDNGLLQSKEIILHAYSDGFCPCLDRVKKMSIKYQRICNPGTSEDAALLLTYHYNAEKIVLLGGHKSICDFIEKGRNGMGSTLLTRLIVGDRLIDFRGISQIALLQGVSKSSDICIKV